MTNISYISKYAKIYFWQGAAFVLRFASMFIVIPYLTKEPSTYGIYAVCISISFFLGYGDLGFLSAGQKYSAECCARDDRQGEMKHIGFGTFVLLIFTLICALVFFYLALHPQNLIKGLDTPEKTFTASRLLLILACFTPVTVLQRMVSMIFDIRLDSYVNQRISLFASIATIGSVFYFFRSGNYQIVAYFLFSQIASLIATLISIWLAKKKYNYNIKQLFRCVRFDRGIYKKANSLAYSGLYVMVVWIVFYELDQLAIGKFIGIDKVAIYTIAFSFATLFRSIYGIFFSPFTVRANYFVGNCDEEGLKRFCLQLFLLSAPLVVLPTIAFALIARPFVLSWVGSGYIESVSLARLFSLIFTLSFISYPASMILIVKLRMKAMYIIATIQPIIYWIGVVSTYSFFGLLSFGLFKLIATLVAEVYYFYILINYLNMSPIELIKKVFYPIVLPILFLIIMVTFSTQYLPYEKSKINLLIVISTTGICILASFIMQYFISSDIRIAVKNLIRGIIPEKV